MDDTEHELQRVIRRHYREKRELQAHIQTLKASVPKNDKGRRKQLLSDIARLEAEMEQRHEQELEKFGENPESGVDSVTADLKKMNLENMPPRPAKSQKRRDRRANLERRRQERMPAAQAEQLAAYRREEEEKVAAILGAKNLEMKTIPADGHCMYRAIQDQLVFSVTIESLRYRTAYYMRKHIDDFLPFFTEPEAGNFYTREDFLRYCDDIVHKASWGGQLELRALSHVLQTPIEVVQANSPIIVIGEEYTRKPLTLVYLHYACDFGEHYNSVKPIEVPGAVGGMAPRLF
ncbi:OTU domain-containing protein 6A [Rattus norvegicus]|uniref:ubiquitinyl hydrolase 1 n=1 Tax=Rattus norvegicus TaxID=10116 RepID=D3ZX46_RAT|nr:OTU domain-containing protein 6A [Rattus norvegicus]XP_032745768.1 OTU domain-containing protein 6A [Rattus rattus]|eukprot:XP_228584.1 PREDICTED: OTU domain-containing protein 6A [Rattus norvegicus]